MYSASSNPSTQFNSPAVSSFPLTDSPPHEGIRLPNAPLEDIAAYRNRSSPLPQRRPKSNSSAGLYFSPAAASSSPSVGGPGAGHELFRRGSLPDMHAGQGQPEWQGQGEMMVVKEEPRVVSVA